MHKGNFLTTKVRYANKCTGVEHTDCANVGVLSAVRVFTGDFEDGINIPADVGGAVAATAISSDSAFNELATSNAGKQRRSRKSNNRNVQCEAHGKSMRRLSDEFHGRRVQTLYLNFEQ